MLETNQPRSRTGQQHVRFSHPSGSRILFTFVLAGFNPPIGGQNKGGGHEMLGKIATKRALLEVLLKKKRVPWSNTPTMNRTRLGYGVQESVSLSDAKLPDQTMDFRHSYVRNKWRRHRRAERRASELSENRDEPMNKKHCTAGCSSVEMSNTNCNDDDGRRCQAKTAAFDQVQKFQSPEQMIKTQPRKPEHDMWKFMNEDPKSLCDSDEYKVGVKELQFFVNFWRKDLN